MRKLGHGEDAIEMLSTQVALAFSDVLMAFEPSPVGTKVLDRKAFTKPLLTAIAAHNFFTGDPAGQAFIMLPPECAKLVSAGIGKRVAGTQNYVLRDWRGRVERFLKREHALPCTGVAAIVYSREAYLNDPQVKGSRADEVARITGSPADRVLVALLGFAGPKPPLDPFRFVSNLAGNNNAWTHRDDKAKPVEARLTDALGFIQRVQDEASLALGYDDVYCVVADEEPVDADVLAAVSAIPTTA